MTVSPVSYQKRLAESWPQQHWRGVLISRKQLYVDQATYVCEPSDLRESVR
jgi:hypothetical protein